MPFSGILKSYLFIVLDLKILLIMREILPKFKLILFFIKDWDLFINILYQWRLVTFQPGDAVQKSTLLFLKFYFNLRFIFANFIEYPIIFVIFSNLTLD